MQKREETFRRPLPKVNYICIAYVQTVNLWERYTLNLLFKIFSCFPGYNVTWKAITEVWLNKLGAAMSMTYRPVKTREYHTTLRALADKPLSSFSADFSDVTSWAAASLRSKLTKATFLYLRLPNSFSSHVLPTCLAPNSTNGLLPSEQLHFSSSLYKYLSIWITKN